MKAKRLLAMLMALVMMLGLMPMSALAADEAANFSKPTLFYREPIWDMNENRYCEDPNSPAYTQFDSFLNRGSRAIFYFFDGTTIHRVPNDKLFSDNNKIVEINLHNDFPILQFSGYGSANICYTHTDGKTYKLPVSVALNDVDFYSTSTPSGDTFLSEFTVTNSNRTLYLAALDGFTIRNVTPGNNWPDSNIEIAPDGSYAKVTIKLGAKWNENYHRSEVSIHFIGEDGIDRENHIAYIRLIDDSDRMVYRYVVYDANGTALPDSSWVNSNYYNGPYANDIFLFMSIGGKEIRVNPAKVVCGDPVILELTPDTSGKFLHINPIGFGETTLSYTHTDGKTYSFPVSIVLPDVAFYSQLEAKEEYFIKDFAASETNNTIYLVAVNNYTLSDIQLSGFPEGTTVELSADKTVATIVIGQSGAHGDAYAQFNITTPGGQSWQNGASLSLTGVSPTFGFYYADSVSGSPTLVDNSFSTELWTMPMVEDIFPALLINGKFLAVDPAKVYSENASAIHVKPNKINPAALEIDCKKIGKTKLFYKHTDGVTYSFTIDVQRPYMGFYTSPDGKNEDFITDFQLTESNNVIYLVTQDFPWGNNETLPVTLTNHLNFPKGTTFQKTDKSNITKITLPTDGYPDVSQFTVFYDGCVKYPDGRVYNTYASCNIFVNANVPAETPFVDVAKKDYFCEPVLWALENGITGGLDATHFGPNNPCTRGQVVTFLWRANGSPEPQSANHPFTDISADKYYYKAVLWAVENGITSGLTATTFAPNNACTRGQIATFLWRANGSPEPHSADNPFSDVNAGPFYKAILWAVENGITTGYAGGTFRPNNVCTRGNIVTFLHRAAQ